MYGFFTILMVFIAGCQPLESSQNFLSNPIKNTNSKTVNNDKLLPNIADKKIISKKEKPIIIAKALPVKVPNLPHKKEIYNVNIFKALLANEDINFLFEGKETKKTKIWRPVIQRFNTLTEQRRTEIRDFYKSRNHKAAWLNSRGLFNQNGTTIRQYINNEIYLTTPIETPFIKQFKKQTKNQDQILSRDLETSLQVISAFELIRNGLTVKTALQSQMGINENNSYKPFKTRRLFNLLAQGKIRATFDSLTDYHPQYALLKKEMARLSKIVKKGGYTKVPAGKMIKPNMKSKLIPKIRRRLKEYGYLVDNLNSTQYDTYLVNQVKSFQRSKGLKADGIIGNNMYKALQQDINEHVIRVLVNIERIRHAPIIPSNKKQIRVNIPALSLDLYQKRKNILSMKTIVGRIDRPTPIFNDIMEYIDFNPYWHVPYSLATKDILPELKKNPLYAKRKGIKIYRKNKVINPKSVNWRRYSENNFPFILRQEPGYKNALGTVKFIFPNKHAVYLHDTPAKSKFYPEARFFSSGCVRVEKPKALAKALLNRQVSATQIASIFKAKKNKAVYLKRKTPVVIEYLTAFVKDYRINIRPDIYEYDPPLIKAIVDAAKQY